jgi:hypothetical protein
MDAGAGTRRLPLGGLAAGAAIRLNRSMPAPSSEELSQHLRVHGLATHIPVQWRFLDELPRNASMKIDRQGVKHLFEFGNGGSSWCPVPSSSARGALLGAAIRRPAYSNRLPRMETRSRSSTLKTSRR